MPDDLEGSGSVHTGLGDGWGGVWTDGLIVMAVTDWGRVAHLMQN